MDTIPASLAQGLMMIPVVYRNGNRTDALSVRVEAACCGDTLSIGGVYSAQLTVKLAGTLEWTGETITAAVQSADRTQVVDIGTFRITSCTAGETVTTLTAYDAAYYALSGEYEPDTQAPPTTALAVLGDIAAQCGLVLADTSGLTDQPISGALTGCTCRDMAGYMAALVGCNAVIDREGRLALRWFTDSGQHITPDEYYAGALKLEGEQTLAGLRMVRKTTLRREDADGIITEEEQSEIYTAGSGSGLVIEVENPFATQESADAVWAKIGALGVFRTGSCAWFGGLETEPGDVLTVTDLQGVTSVLPVMHLTLELDGGCRASAEAAGESETAAAGLQGPLGRLLSRIEADMAAFKELTAENFDAAVAKVNELYADDAWVKRLFAQDIEAEGTITGAKLIGALLQGKFIDLGASDDDGAWVGYRDSQYARLQQKYDEALNGYTACIEVCDGRPAMRVNRIYLDGGKIELSMVGMAGSSRITMEPGAVLLRAATGAHEYPDGTITLNCGKVEVTRELEVAEVPLLLTSTTLTYSNWVCGVITGGAKRLAFTVPLSRPLKPEAAVTCSDLSLVLRHADGGYPFARSGSSGGTYTQLGSGQVSVWAQGESVRDGEVSSVTCQNRGDTIRVQVDFAFELSKASGNTAAVTNNVPANPDIVGVFQIS